MQNYFSSLFDQHLDQLTRIWVDEIFAEPRTDLRRLLSFRELVECVPEVLDELGALLDAAATDAEIVEAAERLRGVAQTRCQQRALLDEVARELMILRDVSADFLWRHAPGSGGGREFSSQLRLLHRFFDEVIAQTILVYAVSSRPTFQTRAAVWPPPRGRRGRME